MAQNGGRFDFDDGGSYSGGWLDGKAHGYGVCTGPKGQGEYAGAWVRGFEESGVYTWPSGNTYSGEWQDGKRHGVGVEIKGHWVYRGEWSQGYKGRYGIRQSTISCARYEGTWTTSFQDGYGVETYVDEGSYQGQWQRGMRHGFGVRHSAPFGIAAQYRDKEHLHASLPSSINSSASMPTGDSQQLRGRSNGSEAAVTDRHRGGFVLTGRSTPGFNDAEQMRSRSSSSGRSFVDRRGQSTGDLPRAVQSPGRTTESPVRGTGSGRSVLGGSGDTGRGLLGSNVDIADGDVTETYMGEWKTDKRSGFGISERSDGLKYVGEWYNDKKYGYGVTTLKDGTKEEGKYKDNELITSGKKRKLFAVSKTRLRDRVDAAIVSASRAAEVAQQKAVIATARRASSRQKAESSDKAAMKALADADLARDEADKFYQNTPQTATVPVGQETRVRLLPGQEAQHRSSSQQPQRRHHSNLQQGKTGESDTTTSSGKTSSRLLPPRQESSDSYTSNQSSSLGSSSVTTTSPPPPKPPRSSPTAVDHHGTAPADQTYNNRGPAGQTHPGPSRPEPPVVIRTTAQVFATSPRGEQQQHLANHTRPQSDERGYGPPGSDVYPNPAAARTNLTGGVASMTRRSNSVRDFSPQTERDAYLDVSDSGDSGHQESSASSRVPREGGPTSPQILLHPPTPRQGSQRGPPQDERVRQRYPSVEEPPSSRSQVATMAGVSPVKSNRQYEQPISHGFIDPSNPDPSRGGRDVIVEHHHHHPQLSNSHPDDHHPDASVSTARHSDGIPRHLPQPPSSNARIPSSQQNPSNLRSSSTAAPSSSARNPSSSFRSHQDSRSGRGVGVRSGTSSPNAWDRPSLRRRETLPNIVQYPLPNAPSKPGKDGGGGGNSDPRRPSRDTYIVENGVRRRLITDPSTWETPATEREPTFLLQRFTVEPNEPTGVLERRGYKASLPDVHRARETMTCLPREQAFVLSQQRRDELRREREERERETVIIRLADIKTWCKDNQLILFLVALNLSLAAMFLSFLTRSKDASR